MSGDTRKQKVHAQGAVDELRSFVETLTETDPNVLLWIKGVLHENERLWDILQNVSNDIHANDGYVTTSVGGQVDLVLMARPK